MNQKNERINDKRRRSDALFLVGRRIVCQAACGDVSRTETALQYAFDLCADA
jgi:hypothetical protein